MSRAYRKLQRELRQKAEKHYYDMSFGRGKQKDDTYALPGDEPLTPEEIEQIKAFWAPYRFAYPEIDFQSFQTFKNRSGRFDPRHVPGPIRSHLLKFVDTNYSVGFQNKAMLGMLYPGIAQPRTFVRRMNRLYYDENYGHINMNQALDILMEELKTRSLIFKLNFTCGGKGVFILDKETTTRERLRHLFTVKYAVNAFVIQELLEQSPFMAAFNPSSVNTIRMTTLLFNGEAHCLAALIRIGTPGSFVDNFSSGGSLLHVDIQTGKCQSWAMNKQKQRITQLPSGLDLSASELIIPNFEAVKAIVAQQHYRIPYIRLVSWDIALDKNNTPTMLECNFAGDLQLHEAVNGPLFGDLTQPICDEYLLKRFSLQYAENHFLFREYHDHVVIEEYLGKKKKEKVSIPTTFHGKPVTSVDPKAFSGAFLEKSRKEALQKCPAPLRRFLEKWYYKAKK